MNKQAILYRDYLIKVWHYSPRLASICAIMRHGTKAELAKWFHEHSHEEVTK